MFRIILRTAQKQWVLASGKRQSSDKKSLTSQSSDNIYNLQISDRKGGSKQFSGTHMNKDSLYLYAKTSLLPCM